MFGSCGCFSIFNYFFRSSKKEKKEDDPASADDSPSEQQPGGSDNVAQQKKSPKPPKDPARSNKKEEPGNDEKDNQHELPGKALDHDTDLMLEPGEATSSTEDAQPGHPMITIITEHPSSPGIGTGGFDIANSTSEPVHPMITITTEHPLSTGMGAGNSDIDNSISGPDEFEFVDQPGDSNYTQPNDDGNYLGGSFLLAVTGNQAAEDYSPNS
jgi:hypothetical protein